MSASDLPDPKSVASESFAEQYAVEGGYEDERGAFWEDPLLLIHGSLFGFCCCGRPHDTLRKIRDAMLLVRTLHEMRDDGHGPWLDNYAAWKERRDATLGDSATYYTFWYLLDREGLTEHGGSVPGWLTYKGETVLRDLVELLPE